MQNQSWLTSKWHGMFIYLIADAVFQKIPNAGVIRYTAFLNTVFLTNSIDFVTTTVSTISTTTTTCMYRSLNSIAQTVRFGMAGVLSNVTFLAGFNLLVEQFAHQYESSRIYSVWYCCFIPIAHAIQALLVFGWPDPYWPSLLSNAPIGLTAMTIGTLLTGYLDRVQFDRAVQNFLEFYLPFLTTKSYNHKDEDAGEFYSSLVVMGVTGIFSYLASVYVNSGPKTADAHKKEL